MRIYDTNGRHVHRLIDGLPFDAGSHAVRWDGRDHHRRQVASGVYFYRIDAGGFRQVRRMVLLR